MKKKLKEHQYQGLDMLKAKQVITSVLNAAKYLQKPKKMKLKLIEPKSNRKTKGIAVKVIPFTI
ncbi:MAG: hypothetical protein DBX48_03955 [Limosilactobacillus fermentum]|nr:MAG: hypothetical protein DBX48_03955 [Limosilactobacillus fermentum]